MTTKWSDVSLAKHMAQVLTDAKVDPVVAKIGIDAIIGFVKQLAVADPPLRIVDEHQWILMSKIVEAAGELMDDVDADSAPAAYEKLGVLLNLYYDEI